MIDNKKTIITLVGLRQAKKGFAFLNEESLKECENCEFFKICISKLEVGRVYFVTEVRDKVFPCRVHEEGVRIVKVSEPSIEASIQKRSAFQCGIITYMIQDCEESLCPYYKKCVPQGLKIGDKCKIVSVKEQIACPLNRQLVLAVLQRVVN